MSEVTVINKTAQVITSGSAFFCDRAKLVHKSAATLKLYSGNATDNNKVLIGALGCIADSADETKIEYNCKNGIYAEMTATGSGYGVGLLYQR